MENREAYIILNALPDIGPLRVNQLLVAFGQPAAILNASQDSLMRVPGVGAKVANSIRTWNDHVDLGREIQLCETAGVTVITREDDAYPPLLKQIHDPPLCLYTRGNTNALTRSQSSIAVVGSRRTTRYGIAAAETLTAAASLAGWTVVSGLARGIDTVAHETTVKTNGTTVAVIGSGLGRIYPQENIELARRICQNGAVVSEFPMTFAPAKRTFPMRNRVISGMTRGTIVVEAGNRSGSLITASQAAEQNRLVFAVPGRIDSPQSRGCHQLLKEGARLVESFQDVLEEFTMLPGFHSVTTPRGATDGDENTTDNSKTVGTATSPLTDLEHKLLACVGHDEMPIDHLVQESGQSPAEVLRTLLNLEMKRLIRQLPGKRVARIENTASG
ncbi:MAG: DNA-processing protein DprA [Candidatus Pacebacteria bacterium]|nr:DNA-processing protein DprA [Candidatus Paceibacterota bacterium]